MKKLYTGEVARDRPGATQGRPGPTEQRAEGARRSDEKRSVRLWTSVGEICRGWENGLRRIRANDREKGSTGSNSAEKNLDSVSINSKSCALSRFEGAIILQPRYSLKSRALLYSAAFLLTVSSARADVVMDQIGNPLTYDTNTFLPGNTAGQVFTDFPTFTAFCADDFTVTGGQLNVTSVAALYQAANGFVNFASVVSYRVNFYSSTAMVNASEFGDVGSVNILAGAAAVSAVGATSGLVSLILNFNLPSAGTYWISISPVSSFATTGQFFTDNNGGTGPNTPGNSNSFWANPAGGFGQGPGATNANYAFMVNAGPSAVPEPATVFAGIGALLAVGGAVVRRRKI